MPHLLIALTPSILPTQELVANLQRHASFVDLEHVGRAQHEDSGFPFEPEDGPFDEGVVRLFIAKFLLRKLAGSLDEDVLLSIYKHVEHRKVGRGEVL